jgi:CubicO group peptidase (beta-lactamase class C family)
MAETNGGNFSSAQASGRNRYGATGEARLAFRHAIAAAFLLLSAPGASVASQPSATTASLHLTPSRIDRTLREMVAHGRVAGASVLIWRNGREAYFGSAGYADREANKAIRRDTLFQVFSMTKPVTGVGLMRLWEQGKFGLDEPLAKYLPEYAATKVFVGLDSTGKPILKGPERPILIRDILRHTAGFAYWDGPTYPEKVLGKVDPLNLGNTLAEFSEKMATIPLMYEPGTQWRYSAAADVQARLIEKLSSQPFETYMQDNVLKPLGMTDSGWTQPESRFPRLATAYEIGPDKKLRRKSEKDIRALNFSDRKLTMGGAGIATTADDYMRFARMLLGHGSLGSTRILKPSTVRLMTTDQLEPRIAERLWLPEKGNGGFGFDVFVRDGRPLSARENRGATGEFFWDGAWTSLFWVDPANDMAVVFMVQKDPYDFSLIHDIREAVYGAAYLGPVGD